MKYISGITTSERCKRMVGILNIHTRSRIKSYDRQTAEVQARNIVDEPPKIYALPEHGRDINDFPPPPMVSRLARLCSKDISTMIFLSSFVYVVYDTGSCLSVLRYLGFCDFDMPSSSVEKV